MIVSILLEIAAVALLLPVLVLFTEVLFSLPRDEHHVNLGGPRQRLAVLMPAHNEASTIAGTLRSIIPQLNETDRVLVVADNCADDTAAIASSEGADVIGRFDLSCRGKGYALDFGVRHLERDPPEIIVIIDADCQAAPDSIDKLTRLCTQTARPVQALYLMHAGKDSGLKMRIAEFAWIVKNKVRPLGLRRMGLPCQLMGTGMAFPWTSIRMANLATGHIVEDLRLGIDLATTGKPPVFCADALVTSNFPISVDGVQVQRTRWEHGHLSLVICVPKLLLQSFKQMNMGLLALTLDLSVPPLALLTLLVVGVLCASAIVLVYVKTTTPFAIAAATAILLGLSVVISWARYGRQTLSIRQLLFAALYALWKIPLYTKFLVARQVDWVRSRRSGDK